MKTTLIIVTLIGSITLLFSDTHIPAGNVYGNWFDSNNPYIIDGNIDIPVDSTLCIYPGVNILFSDHYEFSVHGNIIAIGTYTDTICFTVQDTSYNWQGFLFIDTNTTNQDSSIFTYCKIEYAHATDDTLYNFSEKDDGGAINCDNSSRLLISKCLIQNNSAENNGGGIYLVNSTNIIIRSNTIRNNHCGTWSWFSGGGIICTNNSTALIDNNTIKYNQGWFGGGICSSSGSDVNIINNEISYNQAEEHSGGIKISCSNSLVSNNNISNNSGGGICISGYTSSCSDLVVTNNLVRNNSPIGIQVVSSSPTLINNTIVNNISMPEYGGGIFCSDGSPTLINCILRNNGYNEIYFLPYMNENSITISYCNIEGGHNSINTNGNGTYIWLEGNIDCDPLFIDSLNNDFHLQFGSPCIDSGDPDLDGDGNTWLTDPDDQDPDGTRLDMGAYYFDQSSYYVTADFTADPTSGFDPSLEVDFTDLSQGNVSDWYWDFENDGIFDSTEQNPSFTYEQPGIYSVKLKINNGTYVDSLIKYDYIKVFNGTTDFVADPTSGYYQSPVNFTELSLGNVTERYWDFENDGIFDSTEQNPSFTYELPGIYSVKLKVYNGTFMDSVIKYDYITVEFSPPAPPSNVQINLIYPDAVISWTAADTTMAGTPITPDGYIVYYSEDPGNNDDNYFFLAFTATTSYTHEYVGQFSDQMFYKVVAYVDLSETERNYLIGLNTLERKVRECEVKKYLKLKR